MKYLLFCLLLVSCAPTPVKGPSIALQAACPEPLAVEKSVREWYRICRDAAFAAGQ